LFTTGSTYAYLGGDKILVTRTGTATVVRIMEVDLVTREIKGRGTTTFLSGTVTIGNIMEAVTAGGYTFAYILQSGGTLFARAVML
jgi:hypothetical protein